MDTTSFHVDGQYDVEEDQACVRLEYGYSRDGHPELKQAILQLIATSESNLPTYMNPTNGSCNDQKTIARLVSSHIQSLRDATGSRHIVGDCAMYTPKSICAFHENKVCFVTRVPSTLAQAKHYLNTTRLEMMEDIGDGYFACEYLVNTYECPQRWVVVYSTKAKRRNESIQKRKWGKLCEKAEMNLRRLRRKTFSCQADAQRAILEYATSLC